MEKAADKDFFKKSLVNANILVDKFQDTKEESTAVQKKLCCTFKV